MDNKDGISLDQIFYMIIALCALGLSLPILIGIGRIIGEILSCGVGAC